MIQAKVLIAAPVHPVLTDGLTSAGYTCVQALDITQSTAPAEVSSCVGIITSTRLQLNKELIATAPNLQWIGRMGSGMEVIDVEYANSKNISCFSSPEGNSNAVAEHALGMLLTLNKRIAWSAQQVQKGEWLREENRGTEIEGKTIGIIGFGHTGRAFARVLQGFGAELLAYDVVAQANVPGYITISSSLKDIHKETDIISFHVPINSNTHHYFARPFIDKMAKPFIVINTSRGEVVDSAALEKAISSGQVKGACLDVWEAEPLQKMPQPEHDRLIKLSTLPQVIITPHIAGYTHEALFKMSNTLLNKILSTSFDKPFCLY